MANGIESPQPGMAALDLSALENVPTRAKAVEIADQAIGLVPPITPDPQGKN
jgi:hypothetical protein